MLPPPVWFNDNHAEPVRNLLRWYIIQLNQKSASERIRPLVRTINSNTVPALFDYSALEEIDFLWEAIVELSKPPYEIWNAKGKFVLAALTPDKTPSLLFNYPAEALVRIWMNMPQINAQQQRWLEALDSSTNEYNLDLEFLRQFGYPGVYGPEELLLSLNKIKHYVLLHNTESLSWRRLSARFFFGDSKYLESLNRQQWLKAIFPQLQTRIKARELLLTVHLVAAPQGVLIIENQDTFCWLCEQSQNIPCVKHLHLVYGHGFTGSAQRARDRLAIRFNFNVDGQLSELVGFEQSWFQQSESELPFYFWGDLDFSGLAILKALRQNFPYLTAWQPGYQPMLAALEQGVGHTPEQAGKTGQYFSEHCGCNYADQTLAPALVKTGLFIDQEWMCADLLSQ